MFDIGLNYLSLTKCFQIIKVKSISDISDTNEVESLSRLEISLSPEITERMDEVIELLGYGSREELVLCVLRRFLDQYHIPIKAR